MSEQQPARDPFYDLDPERMWLLITNIGVKSEGMVKVILEVNGKEKELYHSYVHDGVVSHSINLTGWLKRTELQSLRDRLSNLQEEKDGNMAGYLAVIKECRKERDQSKWWAKQWRSLCESLRRASVRQATAIKIMEQRDQALSELAAAKQAFQYIKEQCSMDDPKFGEFTTLQFAARLGLIYQKAKAELDARKEEGKS